MCPAGRALRFWALRLGVTLAAAVALDAQAPPEEWRMFEGGWSAVGRRQTLPTEGTDVAASVQLSGTLTLTSGAGLTRGFRAEAIGYDDGQGISTGRAVWTDAAGAHVFSVFKGEAIGTGRRILGTITGGTGRYAGAIGDYSLTWQYVVVQTDENVIQGRATDVRGKLRLREAGRP